MLHHELTSYLFSIKNLFCLRYRHSVCVRALAVYMTKYGHCPVPPTQTAYGRIGSYRLVVIAVLTVALWSDYSISQLRLGPLRVANQRDLMKKHRTTTAMARRKRDALHPTTPMFQNNSLQRLVTQETPSLTKSATIVKKRTRRNAPLSKSSLFRADGTIPAGYVAICTVVKDAHRDIREWVEYHLWIGVSTLYIWDDGSDPPMWPLIADYIASGRVVYVPVPPQRTIWHHSHEELGGRERTPSLRYGTGQYHLSAQGWGFDHCLSPHVRRRHRWIAAFDIDEFLVVTQPHAANLASNANDAGPRDVRRLLRQLEHCASILVNWVPFGTSGHAEQPSGGVLATHVRCAPPDAFLSHSIKVIANTRWATGFPRHMHRAGLLPGAPASCTVSVSATYRIDDPDDYHTRNATHSPLALFHYVAKSHADIAVKLAKGGGDGIRKTAQYMSDLEGNMTSECTGAIRLAADCCPSTRGDDSAAAVALVLAAPFE